ncbi:MAG: sugar transferase [Deltaproteobacteria bacterium]|nr:sugar transferase [Deltaproteobacteria bacterium]
MSTGGFRRGDRHEPRGLSRALEVGVALAALVVAAPAITVAALAIVATSGRPVLFRQVRVGLGGRPFTLLKLRTMRAGRGIGVTASDDARVTAVGRVLRRTKLDELPELWNVARGDMALVGPRPELPCFVDLANPRWRRALSVRQAPADPVTIALRDEEGLLGQVPGDREAFYRAVWLPRKLDGYVRYLERRSPLRDLKVLARTVIAVVAPDVASCGAWRDLVESSTTTTGGVDHGTPAS